jgi:Ca2+-binding EF-hand superfamily protein
MSVKPQTLVQKAFCCASYCKLGAVVSRRLLRRKADLNHKVYRVLDPQQLQVFDKLSLNRKMVEQLYEIFQDIDRDGSGEISHYEFFRFFRHKRFPERSKFSKKIFKAFDLDGSGEIDFQEFVLCLWNFCSCTKESLFRLSFELYDTDRSGYIDERELRKILKELYGKDKYEKNAGAQSVLRQLRMMDGEINFAQFAEFCRRFPALLFPAFTLQSCLQQNILGYHFWEEAAAQRHALEREVAAEIVQNQHMKNGPVGGLRYTDLIEYLNACATVEHQTAGHLLDRSADGELVVPNTPSPSPPKRKLSVQQKNPVSPKGRNKSTVKPKLLRKSRSLKCLVPAAVGADHPWICRKCAHMNQPDTKACHACRSPFTFGLDAAETETRLTGNLGS